MQDNREKLLQSITEALQELNIDALEMVDNCFLQVVKDKERYSIHTTEERLAELKAAAAARDKAEKAEREAKQAEREAFRAVFLYDRNDTMKMLGRTNYWKYCCPSGDYNKGYEDILAAHRYDSNIMEIALDIFGYGMICGIKEQRKRGKAKC